MKPPTCPRCGGSVREPGLWSSDWQCDTHGAVAPFHVAAPATSGALLQLVRDAKVPVWVPNPLPPGWVVSGVAHAGDERTGARATLVALSGPAPLGGPADMFVIAEEPGVGLAARFAGLPSVDPGIAATEPPETKVRCDRHEVPLWGLPTDSALAAFAGEGSGVWLSIVVWPGDARLPLLLDHLALRDLRDFPLLAPDLPLGAPSPRLAPTVQA